MSVSGDGKPDEKTPRSPEPESGSAATEGLPPDRQVDLPPSAEMLRQASGSSIDSFAGEGADLSLLIAEQFQRRYAHFEVDMGSDGKPVELGRGANPPRVHRFPNRKWS